MAPTKKSTRIRKQKAPAAPSPSPSLSLSPSRPEGNSNVAEGGGENAAEVAIQGEAPEESELEALPEEEEAIVVQPEAAELPCRGCYVAGLSCCVLAGSVQCTGCRKGKDPYNVKGHTPSFATDPAIRAALHVMLQTAARKLPSYEPPKTNAISDWRAKNQSISGSALENAAHIAGLERELKRSRKLQSTLETLDAFDVDDDTDSKEESLLSPKNKPPRPPK
ncbi:hypothetical protein V8E36_002017 [Tilletia maclaganii]